MDEVDRAREPAVRRWLAYPSVQIALCVAVFAGVAWQFGPFGTVIASPLLAAAVARPLLNLVGNIRHGMRERVWLPVHGEHFTFHDVRIRVLEDESHCRWVCLADARKAAGIGASEAMLAASLGPRFRRAGKPVQPYVRDDAVIEYLAKSTDARALRFRTWVERTVAAPAQKVRERLGIREDEDE